MGEQSWDERGVSFGSAADVYDSTRPGYPAEAITSILGDEPLTVADLGAGTGILTRRLVACGHRVTAIEPDDAMRARLADTTPAATVLAGSAERVPLPDASVDAVLVGQAYHWFDQERAHAEIARVLRPGGVLAALWNLRNEDEPWATELSVILHGEDDGVDRESPAAVTLHGALAALRGTGGITLTGWLKDPSFGPDFTPIEQSFWPHTVTHTTDTLIQLITSRSYYLTAPPERRTELESRIRRLVATHPDLAGRDTIELPYVTVVFRANRTGTG